MNSVFKKTINQIIIYTGLLLFVAVFAFIPDSFPFFGLSTFYLLILAVAFLSSCYNRTIGTGYVRIFLITLAILIVMWIMLRGAKYNFFWYQTTIRRYLWYLYYIPQILIPLLTLYVAFSIDIVEGKHIPIGWHILTPIAISFIVLVLSNDFHQFVFKFNPGFADWDFDYSYGPMALPIFVFIYGAFIAAFITMLVKCRISYSRRIAWIVTSPFIIGGILMAVSLSGLFKITYIPTTDIFCYMSATFLNACMNIGLLPSNENYQDILKVSSLNITITDLVGNRVYSSFQNLEKGDDIKGTGEDIKVAYESGDDVLTKQYKFSNGFAIWQEDVSEQNRVNEELEHVYERLAEEGELIRLENELKEKNAQVKVRTQLYDSIAFKTADTTVKIHQLATDLKGDRIMNARKICFLGAYLKRYANFVIINEEKKNISINELGLAVRESLKYLNNLGIPGELTMSDEDGILINASDATETFGSIL